MLFDVVEAEARNDFRVWIRFEDDLEGEVDLSHLVGQGVFQRWESDPAEFKRVSVDSEGGTIVWPGGLDVAPDTLYESLARGTSKVKTSSWT